MKQFKVIFEDNHLLVAEKPVNLPTQADSSGDPDFLSLLKEDLKERYQKPGNVYLGLVHRLDRPVGGVMVFAKTSKAAARLSAAIRDHQFQKIYLAVVNKHTDQFGQMRHYLKKDEKANKVTVFNHPQPEAKEARLEFWTLETISGFSLVKINLQTGRPHQIRVQFAFEGYPLYGDQKYGTGQNRPGQQLALWSTQISLTHPVTKEFLTFQSPPPKTYPWDLFKDCGF